MVITFDDVKDIIKNLQIYYPNSFKNYDSKSLNILATQWFDILQSQEKEYVILSVKEYMRNSNEFAPNAGQIYSYIHKNPEWLLNKTIRENFPSIGIPKRKEIGMDISNEDLQKKIRWLKELDKHE